MESPCLYHHEKWRGLFQCCLNNFFPHKTPAAAGDLPDVCIAAKFLHKVGPLVCVCAPYRHPYPTLSVKLEDVNENPDKVNQLYTDIIKNVSKQQGENLQRLLDCVIRNDKTHGTLSHVRFIVILSSLLNGDFTVLKKTNSEPVIKDKLIHTTILQLDNSSPCRFGVLIGKKGKHIKPVAYYYKCRISLKQRWNRDGYIRKVTVFGANENVANKVFNHFEKQVIKKDAFHNARIAQLLARSAYAPRIRATCYAVGQDAKTAATDTYSTKQKHAHSSKQRLKHVTVLGEGGRCINCYKPYSTEEPLTCVHHPGFPKLTEQLMELDDEEALSQMVLELKWTCCQLRINDATVDGQQESHHLTGCKEGLHTWRLVKSNMPSNKARCGFRGNKPMKKATNQLLGGINSSSEVLKRLEQVNI